MLLNKNFVCCILFEKLKLFMVQVAETKILYGHEVWTLLVF